MTAMAPTLTLFDECVLAQIPAAPGRRVGRIVALVEARYFESDAMWAPTRADIVGVLRGLEHLGYIEQNNGWWRRSTP